ncbi:MAG: T9SS type A sorting domain-containing protein, partial [Bacteroidia bacterium]|nr:T9SS type A sorting domain-containing protein [Bacteroidia bacterium]
EMIHSTEVFVYSQDGKLVYQSKLKSESTEVNLQGAANGIYFMQLRNANGNTSSRKIIIE